MVDLYMIFNINYIGEHARYVIICHLGENNSDLLHHYHQMSFPIAFTGSMHALSTLITLINMPNECIIIMSD